MNTLFDITGEFLRLYEMGVDSEEAFAATLESLEFDLECKSRGYVQVMNQLEMEAAEADKYAEAFKKKANVRRANIKRMKERIQLCMETLDRNEVSAGEHTIKLKTNGGIQKLIIDGEVPNNMKKLTIENDDKKIREYLKDHTCNWAHLAERGKHIEVK